MPRAFTLADLVEGVTGGDRKLIARALSLIENRDPLAYDLVRAIYPRTGQAYSIGVTGPPGVGKSTLISAVVGHVRRVGSKVGVISVDPSSPYTRGAVLGDRIRLADHFLDPDVYIRSMATRGHLGGLAETTLQAALVLDAAGKELVFLETVGVGQSEIEIAQVADTVLLVLMPGAGDSVQALKAGLMEIPDVIAVNKRDHPLARTMLQEIRGVLALTPDREWQPPVVLTEAVGADGIVDLWEAVQSHRRFLETDERLDENRRRKLAAEVFAVAGARARSHLEQAVADSGELRELLDEVGRRSLDPLSAVQQILERVFKIKGDGTAGTG